MRDSRIESPKLAQETGRLVCHGWRSMNSGFELHRKDADRISGQYPRDIAPLAGHGTGSIRDQFQRATKDQTGMAAQVAANPHNQTFAVAIQLGLLGAIALFAMWIAHAWQFRGDGFLASIGLMIVAQNFIGSLFNSHLFDFAQGWGYAIGIGVAAGALLKSNVTGQSTSQPKPS